MYSNDSILLEGINGKKLRNFVKNYVGMSTNTNGSDVLDYCAVGLRAMANLANRVKGVKERGGREYHEEIILERVTRARCYAVPTCEAAGCTSFCHPDYPRTASPLQG